MEYIWGHTRRYNDYSNYIKRIFAERVQKVSVDAGFSCPNRDGSKGTGGCTFCNNSSFNPAYCSEGNSITYQIDKGIGFFATKYKTQRYLAYFQAYSNTYESLDILKQRYEEALKHPKVIGLVIGTRPDCVSAELLSYLKQLREEYHITVEYGIESTIDETLKVINRGHSYQDGVEAIKRTSDAGINVGAHLILGLPGEGEKEILHHAEEISKLPLNYLKLHQLQLIRGSVLGNLYERNPYSLPLFVVDQYIDMVVRFLEVLNPSIVMERFISQAPKDLLIAPKWGLKNFEFVAKVEKRLKELDTWQGKHYRVESL